ncbi:MAG: hypothetical protein ACJ8M1_13690 [Chthoniobacterales bacterium]
MTKAELIASQKKLKRSSALGATGFLVVFFGVIFGNLFIGRFMDRAPRPVGVHIAYGIAILAFLVCAIWFVTSSTRRRERRFGLVCPTCRNTISGVLAHIAVASDRCGYCGTRLFPDDSKA